MRLEAVSDNGERVDVTEAVRTMYDLLHSSMDWGSGFLSLEDVIDITRLAETCGFVNLEGAVEQIASYLRMQGPCPTCPAGSRKGYGDWRLAQPTEHGRAVQHHPCGHTFELVMPRGEPASLVPSDIVPEPCRHPRSTGRLRCDDCGAAVSGDGNQ